MAKHCKIQPLFLSDPNYRWLRCAPSIRMTETELNEKYPIKLKGKKNKK